MRYTIIGDPHIKNDNLEVFDQLTTQVEGLGNKTIWLGDLFHTKEVIRGKALNEALKYFSSSKLEHVLIVGNHDYFNLDCNEHSLEAFKQLPNITVVDSLTEVDNNVYAIPYVHDQKILKDTIKQCPKDSVLFGHLELKGFDFGNGHICDKGLTGRSFTKFSKVISGHFHLFQEKGNLTYLGTPFTHNFGEANQEKYIGILEGGNLSLLETEYRKHISIKVDVNLPFSIDFDKRNKYRLVLEGTQVEIDEFKTSIKDTILEYGIKVKTKPTDQTLLVESLDEDVSNLAKFDIWAKEYKNMSNETRELGMSILKGLSI